MTNEEIAVALAEHRQEIGSAKHRINELDEQNDTIQELVVSVKELAVNMQSMLKEQERFAKEQKNAFEHIDALENKPAKNWDTLTTVIITALGSGLVTLILSNVLQKGEKGNERF